MFIWNIKLIEFGREQTVVNIKTHSYSVTFKYIKELKEDEIIEICTSLIHETLKFHTYQYSMQPLFEIYRNFIWYSPIFANTVKDQLSSLDTYLKIKAPFDGHLFGLVA